MNTGRDDAALARGPAEVEAVAQSIDELATIRRRVINVVGHALRTPVTTIAGMANALGSADDDATRTMLIDGLVRNARRVELLLDDLLVAAAVSTALPVGAAEATPVRATFEAAWDALEGPNELAVHGPDLSAMVRTEAFERIAFLVLDNALKYGHGPIMVTIASSSRWVRIEVESDGDAPSDEELENAFELLYRGEHAVMTTPGLGIGLPVARELARADGGDVRLERRGSAVVTTVDLPAR